MKKADSIEDQFLESSPGSKYQQISPSRKSEAGVSIAGSNFTEKLQSHDFNDLVNQQNLKKPRMSHFQPAQKGEGLRFGSSLSFKGIRPIPTATPAELPPKLLTKTKSAASLSLSKPMIRTNLSMGLSRISETNIESERSSLKNGIKLMSMNV